MRPVEEVVAELGAAYDQWKSGEKSKNDLKDEFFKLASQAVQGQERAYKVVVLEGISPGQAELLAVKYHPGWKVVNTYQENGGSKVVLEEDPDFMPYSFEHEGRVFQRQIVAGSPLLDDERLQEEDPELWEEVTFIPEPERQLRPLDELDPETLARLQTYMYEGKPTVKFPAPRASKD